MKTPTLSRLEPPNGYPEAEPEEQRMPNTAWHGQLLWMILEALRWFFREEERVSVEGDMFLYYERGDFEKCVGPDVFVVRGAEKRLRRNWLTWNEGTPQLVIELASESSKARDTGDKFKLYRDVLMVREYFLFDPEGDLLRPRLQGYRLAAGEYVAIEEVDGRLPSDVLGLHLMRHEDELRFWNPATGEWLPTGAERAEQEAARAEEAEGRAEDEAARANDQARRAEAAEKRVRELEAELARRGGTP